MRKLLVIAIIIYSCITGFTVIRKNDNLVGTWTSMTAMSTIPNLHSSEYNYDTLFLSKNGTFEQYTYPVAVLPHAIYGHWKIKADTLVLIAEFENYYFQTKNSGKRFRTKLNGTPNIKLDIDLIGNETYLYDHLNHCRYDKKQ
jgi:hypothetical protein